MLNSKEILANNIKNLMKKYNKTREEVASAIDVKYTTFCDWAKGRTYPKMEYIIKIANYFNVKPYALTEENPNYDKAYMEAFVKDIKDDDKFINIYAYTDNGKIYQESIMSIPDGWTSDDSEIDYVGLVLNDDSMSPIFDKGDTVISDNSGYKGDGYYLLQKKNTNKIIFRNLIIKDEQVCIYVNNQFNINKIVADYMTLKELLDNYIIIGKIKRHIHDFKD